MLTYLCLGGDILMKKTLLTVIAVISIMTFSAGITGCTVIKNKSDAAVNHSPIISKTNEISILNPSPAPVTAMSTQTSNFSSVDSIGAIDFNQYIKKVWVVKEDADDVYRYPSFGISKIVNGQITGVFSLIVDVPDTFGNYGHLTGTINNDTAECQFDNGFGIKGNMKLFFRTNGKIEVTFEYSDKEEADNFIAEEGKSYEYIPFNINNIDGFIPIESQSLIVNLNSWGDVKFVSGKTKGERYTSACFYLTDEDGNILYEFYTDTYVNVDVDDVSFQDVNKDGLKDIIIIVHHTHNPGFGKQFATVFYQKTDGTFYYDGMLDQEINDSDSNKDVKTVTEYLSKKNLDDSVYKSRK